MRGELVMWCVQPVLRRARERVLLLTQDGEEPVFLAEAPEQVRKKREEGNDDKEMTRLVVEYAGGYARLGVREQDQRD